MRKIRLVKYNKLLITRTPLPDFPFVSPFKKIPYNSNIFSGPQLFELCRLHCSWLSFAYQQNSLEYFLVRTRWYLKPRLHDTTSLGQHGPTFFRMMFMNVVGCGESHSTGSNIRQHSTTLSNNVGRQYGMIFSLNIIRQKFDHVGLQKFYRVDRASEGKVWCCPTSL